MKATRILALLFAMLMALALFACDNGNAETEAPSQNETDPVETDPIKTLKICDEVIIKGTRALSKSTDGQICINDAVLVQNNYGSHKYSTKSFITNKTVSDIFALDGDISHTTEVYVVTGTIRQESTAWSLNTYVGDGQNEFFLYAGGKNDYAWLTPYVGQTLTIELAVCDWNKKGNKGCVLSITLADGTQIFHTTNFAN